jgi:hypothetical protein
MAFTITAADFAEYVGADVDDFLTNCLNAGHALVDNYQGSVDTVPQSVHTQAVMICASEIFHRKSAPNGISQFASFDGAPVRVAKDPMNAVYPLLLPYVGFAV